MRCETCGAKLEDGHCPVCGIPVSRTDTFGGSTWGDHPMHQVAVGALGTWGHAVGPQPPELKRMNPPLLDKLLQLRAEFEELARKQNESQERELMMMFGISHEEAKRTVQAADAAVRGDITRINDMVAEQLGMETPAFLVGLEAVKKSLEVLPMPMLNKPDVEFFDNYAYWKSRIDSGPILSSPVQLAKLHLEEDGESPMKDAARLYDTGCEIVNEFGPSIPSYGSAADEPIIVDER